MKGMKSIRESFKTRQVKYGGYAALITIAVIAGIILVNLLMGQITPQIDLTSGKLYSLSEQSLQVLDSVTTPVRFYGLWKPGEEQPDVMTVINLYLAKNRNIRLEVIDPDRNPGFVLKYDRAQAGITRGSLIVEGDKGHRVISPMDMYDINYSQQGQPQMTGIAIERRITSALLFAGTGTTPAVYEITGHEETPLSALGLRETVERENLVLKSLNLLISSIPSDATALIMNGPQRDINPQEAEKLLGYLEKGGRLLMLADFTIRELTNLNGVLASYGLKFDYGILYETDPNHAAQDPGTEIPDLAAHEITQPLIGENRLPVLLFQAMALSTIEPRRRTVEITPLMTSSSASFLRTNVNETAPIKLFSDISGPLTLGMAVTDPSWVQENDPQARIVAIACASLLPLAGRGFDTNRDLFMNSLAWLEDRPEAISVRSKSTFLLPLQITLVQSILFGGLFILVIPAAFFVAGFVTWLKRRHL